MSEPLGFINARDPRFRDLLRHAAGSSGSAAEGAGVGVGTGAVSGAGVRAVALIRPFTGFDRERSTYARLKPELLARAEGQFVVIVGDHFEGPLATFGDAERAGYRRFGLGPLYIKQVLAEEPAQEISRDINLCRS